VPTANRAFRHAASTMMVGTNKNTHAKAIWPNTCIKLSHASPALAPAEIKPALRKLQYLGEAIICAIGPAAGSGPPQVAQRKAIISAGLLQ